MNRANEHGSEVARLLNQISAAFQVWLMEHRNMILSQHGWRTWGNFIINCGPS